MYKTLILKIWDKHVFGRAAAQHAPCEWAVGFPICLLHIFHSGLSWRVWGSAEWQRVYGRLKLVSLFMAPLWVWLARAGGFYAYRLLAEIRFIHWFLSLALYVGSFHWFMLFLYGLPHAYCCWFMLVIGSFCWLILLFWCFCMNDLMIKGYDNPGSRKMMVWFLLTLGLTRFGAAFRDDMLFSAFLSYVLELFWLLCGVLAGDFRGDMAIGSAFLCCCCLAALFVWFSLAAFFV